MDWLRSWVQTPEQRSSDLIQKLLQEGTLSESDWGSLYSDIQSPNIPSSLIAGLPSLMEAMRARLPSGVAVNQITASHLFTTMAKASSIPAHASVLVESQAIDVVMAEWTKEAPAEMIVEILAVLRNLVVPVTGSDAFMSTADGFQRILKDLEGGGGKIEIRVHLLCILTNILANNEFAAFQIVQNNLPLLINKFGGNCNRFAIGALYNVIRWPRCGQMAKAKGVAQLKDPLVRALGDVILETAADGSSTNHKSIEYTMAARVIHSLESSELETSDEPAWKPCVFLWLYEPIFASSGLAD